MQLGGKFFNISKKTWIVKFLALAPDDEIVKIFQSFGCLEEETLIKHIKMFVCNVYSSRSSCLTVSELRWELFRTNSFEGEKLPPTLNIIRPHIDRAHLCPNETNHTKSPDQIFHYPMTMDGNRMPM